MLLLLITDGASGCFRTMCTVLPSYKILSSFRRNSNCFQIIELDICFKVKSTKLKYVIQIHARSIKKYLGNQFNTNYKGNSKIATTKDENRFYVMFISKLSMAVFLATKTGHHTIWFEMFFFRNSVGFVGTKTNLFEIFLGKSSFSRWIVWSSWSNSIAGWWDCWWCRQMILEVGVCLPNMCMHIRVVAFVSRRAVFVWLMHVFQFALQVANITDCDPGAEWKIIKIDCLVKLAIILPKAFNFRILFARWFGNGQFGSQQIKRTVHVSHSRTFSITSCFLVLCKLSTYNWMRENKSGKTQT